MATTHPLPPLPPPTIAELKEARVAAQARIDELKALLAAVTRELQREIKDAREIEMRRYTEWLDATHVREGTS